MTRQSSVKTCERRRLRRWALELGAGLSLLLSNPSAALAEEAEPGADLSRRGAYGAVSYAVSPSYKGSTVGGLNSRAGYRFTRFLAGELEFEWLNVTDLERTAGPDFSINSYNFSGNVKVYPNYRGEQFSLFENRLQPFFNFGAGTILISPQSDNEPGSSLLGQRWRFAARLGGGAEYYATPHVVVVAEGAWKVGVRSSDNNIKKDIDYGVFTLGLQYRF